MMQSKSSDGRSNSSFFGSKPVSSQPGFHETGQLRRAKLHAAHLISTIDNHYSLSPSLRQLLEISLIFNTTDSKVLSALTKRTPMIIHTEFFRVHPTVERHSKVPELHA